MGHSRHMHGRDDLLRQVRDELRPGAILTLVGPGGVGKTRLASALDARFIDLSAARTAMDVMRALTWTAADHADLSAALAALPDTVVLDNLEQLDVEAVSVIGRAVATEHVRWVGTSRHPLGLPGERVLEVPPLALPDAASLADSPAWRVFADAAGLTEPADSEVAARVLALLDGLPLALELAGGRLQLLELEELERRLEADRFPVLADPDRGETDRHGTLWSSLRWSWDLLDTADRVALSALGWFEGPFDVRLAEAVLGADALDQVHRLVRRQLVARRGRDLLLLETVRSFVRQVATPDPGPYAHAVSAAGLELLGPSRDAITNLERLAQLWPDLRQVLTLGRQYAHLSAHALDAAHAMCQLLDHRGPISELEPLAEEALALSGNDSARAQILRLRARWRRRTGRPEDAAADLDHAQVLDPVAINILADRGDLALATGDLVGATERYRAVLVATNGPQQVLVRAALSVALVWQEAQDEALAHARRAAAEAQQLGDETVLAEVMRQAGSVALHLDLYDEAHAYLLEARKHAEAVGVPDRTLALLDGQLGLACECTGDYEGAYARLTDAVRILEPIDSLFAAYYRGLRGRGRLAAGDVDAALADLVPTTAFLAGRDIQGFLPDFLAARSAAHAARGVRDPDADPSWAAIADRVRADLDGVRSSSPLPSPLLDGDSATRQALEKAFSLAELALQTWRIAFDGTWHQPPAAAAVSIAAVANARLLACLARHRTERPGASVSGEVLVEAGWPGERIVVEAARNRVRVAINGLRKAGLRSLILRDKDGWYLDPTAPLAVWPSDTRPS